MMEEEEAEAVGGVRPSLCSELINQSPGMMAQAGERRENERTITTVEKDRERLENGLDRIGQKAFGARAEGQVLGKTEKIWGRRPRDRGGGCGKLRKV